MSDPIIAKVNGSPISSADFNNAVQGYAMELHRKTREQLAADELTEVETLALEKLLARELLYQEALRQGLLATPAAVAETIQRSMGDVPPEAFYAALAQAGIDPETYRRMIRQDCTVNLLTEQETAGLPEPDQAQVEAFYRTHAEQMKHPPRVRASHILLKIEEGLREETRRRMEALREQCRTDDFAALAREFSDCPSGARGGDLGYFKSGDMVHSFSEAAFSQAVGEVGEVVETPFGLHLIKVLDRREGDALGLADAAPRIRRFLKQEAAARHLRDRVEELKKHAAIELR